MRRWCIRPLGNQTSRGLFCRHRTPESCLENAPASSHRLRFGPCSDSVAFSLVNGRSRRPCTYRGLSQRRSIKIIERSKNRSGFIHFLGTPQTRVHTKSRNSVPHAISNRPHRDATWPPRWRPQAHPPISGGTRCRFSIGPTTSLPKRGPHSAAPASTIGLWQSTSCTMRQTDYPPGGRERCRCRPMPRYFHNADLLRKRQGVVRGADYDGQRDAYHSRLLAGASPAHGGAAGAAGAGRVSFRNPAAVAPVHQRLPWVWCGAGNASANYRSLPAAIIPQLRTPSHGSRPPCWIVRICLN